jgi:hypothetical protein
LLRQCAVDRSFIHFTLNNITANFEACF